MNRQFVPLLGAGALATLGVVVLLNQRAGDGLKDVPSLNASVHEPIADGTVFAQEAKAAVIEADDRPSRIAPAVSHDHDAECAKGLDAAFAPHWVDESFEPIASSFRTERPNVAALHEALHLMASVAVVDEASIVRTEGGRVSGKLSCGEVEWSFAVEDDRYDLSWSASARDEADEGPFLRRVVSMSFVDGGGFADEPISRVQYHPDTRRPASDFLHPGDEHYVGWVLRTNAEGLKARPLSMRTTDDARAWVIGHSDELDTIEQPGTPVHRSFDAWLAAVRPHVD